MVLPVTLPVVLPVVLSVVLSAELAAGRLVCGPTCTVDLPAVGPVNLQALIWYLRSWLAVILLG
jgi:hypothetical protein